MTTFRTYCITSQQDTQKICALHNNDDRLVFKPDPTKCYWQSPDGKSFSHFLHPDRENVVPINQILENEFLLQVENEEEAESIISTIRGGVLLAYPDSNFATVEPELLELTNEFNEAIYKERWYSDKFQKFDDFLFGHRVWKIADKNSVLLYAIEKYKLSLALSSFNPHYASPRYGKLFEEYENQFSYHTKAAFAIIAAFSAIEEMGLEIRSSQQKPRFLNPDTGEWNSKVLEDITNRLLQINIKPNDRIDWIFRGQPSQIELALKPYFGLDSEWADGKDVRDKSLTYHEAIHNASYLRNYIAAHKFNELTANINPYDVFNVQNLLRRLILTKMGLWETLVTRHKSG